jgi:CHRD domain/Secretion system C-terminal sorting domain
MVYILQIPKSHYFCNKCHLKNGLKFSQKQLQMKQSSFFLLLLFVLIGSNPLSAQFGTTNRLLFTTDLNGQQEVPAVTTDARGIATVFLSEDRTTMSIHAVFSGLSGPITGCHFHTGAEAVAGPVLIGLTDKVFGNRLRADIPVTTEFLSRALKNEIYLNVHTAANPSGEIRGQLTLMYDNLYAAALTGMNEVPPVTTTATGLFKMSYPPGYFFFQYSGETNGLSGPITQAHIHDGAEGVAGPVVTALNASSSNSMVGTLSLIDVLNVTPNFLEKLDNGTLYVNAHTSANPSGEIRGQLRNLGPLAFESTLNGDQETPPVTTGAFGVAVAGLNTTLDTLTYMVGVNGITPTNAHFHLGAPGVAGPVIVALQTTPAPNFYAAKVPVTSTQVTQLFKGNVYINIHTAANPGGEIRGQMEPLLRRAYVFDLCGEQVAPSTNSSAQGAAWITTDYLNTQLTYRFIVDGLSGPAVAAQIHEGAPGVSGPTYLGVFPPGPVGSGQFQIDGNVTTKLESGNTYLDVSTAAFPDGEIRGQILRELTCSANVGVAELTISSFQITPNPTSGRTTMQFYAESDFDGQLTLTDLTGKLLRQENYHFAAGDQSIPVDLSHIPSGMYIARLSNMQGAQQSFKLIRE